MRKSTVIATMALLTSSPIAFGVDEYVQERARNAGGAKETLSRSSYQTQQKQTNIAWDGTTPLADVAPNAAQSRGGGASYITGFESPVFTPGELDGQNEWYAQFTGDWSVDTTNPASGTQHLRSFVTFTGSSFVLSPTILADATDYSVASARIEIDNVGTGSTQIFTPQDPTNGLVVTRVRFAVGGSIEVLQPDPNDPNAGLFIPTGSNWQPGYNNITVVADRVGSIEVCLGENSIFTGVSFAPNIENVSLRSGMEVGSEGSSAHVDDLVILNTNTGGCTGQPTAQADLGISLSDASDPAQIGEPLVFVVNVANFGSEVVNNAIVELILPSELMFVSGGLSQGSGVWTCGAVDSLVTCELTSGELPVDPVAAALEIEVQATPAANPGIVETTASISSNSFLDPNPANDVDIENTTLEGLGDLIFANDFECESGLDGCPAAGTPGIYTNLDEFLANVATGFYEEDFAGVAQGAGGPSMDFSGNGFAYTISAAQDLFNGAGFISINVPDDTLVITFTGAPVTAIGGNFWPTDFDLNPIGTDITITLSDGTVETFTSAGISDFRGFVTKAPITSIIIDAPDDIQDAWPTLDNIILGQIAE